MLHAPFSYHKLSQVFFLRSLDPIAMLQVAQSSLWEIQLLFRHHVGTLGHSFLWGWNYTVPVSSDVIWIIGIRNRISCLAEPALSMTWNVLSLQWIWFPQTQTRLLNDVQCFCARAPPVAGCVHFGQALRKALLQGPHLSHLIKRLELKSGLLIRLKIFEDQDEPFWDLFCEAWRFQDTGDH